MIRLCFVVPLLFALGCSSAGMNENPAGDLGVGGSEATAGGSGGSSSEATGGTSSHGGSAAYGQGGDLDAAGRGGSANGASGSTAAAGGMDPGGHTNPLSKDLISAFVAAHNAARARTDLNPPPSPPLEPVSWDPLLADSAYNYLSKCVASNGAALVEHNANRSSDYQALGGTDGYVGENIYGTTGTTVAPADAVNAWMSEASSFNYAKPSYTTAGHYSQVVWRASVRIGCAIVNCPNAHDNNTVLCDYAPGGNIAGQKPY